MNNFKINYVFPADKVDKKTLISDFFDSGIDEIDFFKSTIPNMNNLLLIEQYYLESRGCEIDC